MPSTGCKFDVATFQRGLRAKLQVTKRAAADVLNQAAGSALANAVRLTKKADATRIKAELQSRGLAFRLLQSPAMQARLPRRLQGFTRGRYTRQQINAAVAQLIRARMASRGYVAAGWFPALAVFRPNYKRRASDKGLAGKGRATRATAQNLTATFENYSRGAGAVGAAALQQALDEEGRSMQNHAEKKLAQAWK